MSNWIVATESVMTQLNADTGIPWDKDRFTPDPDTSQLPDTFMVYTLVDDPGAAYADGKERSHEVRVQISLFYRDPAVAATIPDKIEAAYMAADFLRVGSGTLPYQTDTGHNGWRCDFRFYERR